MDNEIIFAARARVLADLEARRLASAPAVSALEESLAQRRWWADQWPQGTPYVAGLVAQDVQDSLFDGGTRWPLCTRCTGPEHSLHIEPDLGGPDPVWVCEEAGEEISPLGSLA